jgi:HEPN domain-containing protein
MDAQEKFEYWLDIAQYDLDVADSMLVSKRWLYVVFMCQQAIEKLIKGLYQLYRGDDIPHIHNINAIISRFEDTLPFVVSEEHTELFRKLTMYYINNRYPDYLAKLSEQITEAEAREVFAKTKEVFSWLLTFVK